MGGWSEIYFEFIIIQHLLGRTKAATSWASQSWNILGSVRLGSQRPERLPDYLKRLAQGLPTRIPSFCNGCYLEQPLVKAKTFWHSWIYKQMPQLQGISDSYVGQRMSISLTFFSSFFLRFLLLFTSCLCCHLTMISVGHGLPVYKYKIYCAHRHFKGVQEWKKPTQQRPLVDFF